MCGLWCTYIGILAIVVELMYYVPANLNNCYQPKNWCQENPGRNQDWLHWLFPLNQAITGFQIHHFKQEQTTQHKWALNKSQINQQPQLITSHKLIIYHKLITRHKLITYHKLITSHKLITCHKLIVSQINDKSQTNHMSQIDHRSQINQDTN